MYGLNPKYVGGGRKWLSNVPNGTVEPAVPALEYGANQSTCIPRLKGQMH